MTIAHPVKNILKYTGIGLLIFIIGSLIIGLVILRREYDKFQPASAQADYELPLTASLPAISNQEGPVSAQYQLLEGWNFVAFPFTPISFTTAADLITEIAQNGGFISVVATWDGDRWQEFVHSGENQYGQNFPIEPGKAYFLRSHETFDFTAYGTPLTSPPPIDLKAGWNGVGFIPKTSNLKAETILDTINQGADNAREIDHWWSGSWDVFVRRTYSSDNIKSYGNNFVIDPAKGYLVNLQSPATYPGGQP